MFTVIVISIIRNPFSKKHQLLQGSGGMYGRHYRAFRDNRRPERTGGIIYLKFNQQVTTLFSIIFGKITNRPSGVDPGPNKWGGGMAEGHILILTERDDGAAKRRRRSTGRGFGGRRPPMGSRGKAPVGV